MRIDRKRVDAKRAALASVGNVKLVEVKGGLKAERVQGTDPSGLGGD
jgi:hypothetical protein